MQASLSLAIPIPLAQTQTSLLSGSHATVHVPAVKNKSMTWLINYSQICWVQALTYRPAPPSLVPMIMWSTQAMAERWQSDAPINKVVRKRRHTGSLSVRALASMALIQTLLIICKRRYWYVVICPIWIEMSLQQ